MFSDIFMVKVTDLESNGQSLVAPPVRGQHRAEEVGTVCLHQLTWMIWNHLQKGTAAASESAHLSDPHFHKSVHQYLHHATVSHAQLAHQSAPAPGLLGTQGQGLGHLSPWAERGGGWGVTPAGRWVWGKQTRPDQFPSCSKKHLHQQLSKE